jgi:K+-sensing histidine kinase KdpD
VSAEHDQEAVRRARAPVRVSRAWLQSTVEDLLALARDTRQEPAELDVDGLLAEAGAQWRDRANGQRLRIDRAADAPAARAWASAVHQVVTVLLDNAAVHGRGTVTVTARETGGVLAVDVAMRAPGSTGRRRSCSSDARRRPAGTASGWRWPAASPRPKAAGCG